MLWKEDNNKYLKFKPHSPNFYISSPFHPIMYDFKKSEEKWQDYWEKEKIYRFDPNSNKPVYSIDVPPRYASGRLHIGHATHYSHIDIIARYKRMRGYNVFFPLCFDVNGMPIEVNVEKKYKIKMRDTSRQEFIKLCREFANANIGEMINQFKILGESMDPALYYQTDASYYRLITQLSFIEIFKRGLVYKAKHPVNWCPRCGTAIADAEIEHQTRKTKLNYIVFSLREGGTFEIATTRPELLCTCQLIAVHPDDKRYKDLVGKYAIVPIYGQEVEIIADEKVDPKFGTGGVMICSVGDKDDLEWIYKYHLEFQEGINDQGRMTERAGRYAGMRVEKARNAIIKDLKKEGLLVKQEEIEQNVGVCWRCQTPIELINKEQWFINILKIKDDIIKTANEINWIPKFMKKRLEDWIDSLEWDWVVSRQRYFATPIPIWECENGHAFVPDFEELLKMKRYVDPTVDKPLYEKCPICGAPVHGTEDVFDTWVDSSISPLFNTFWARDEEKFRVLYPMSLRPQSHDIIRTWAFYTILRTKTVTGKLPWRDIFVDSFILAPDGRPMHTSWGNVVDPLKIVDEYSTDAFRFFAANCTIGEDTPFRYKDVKRGKKLIIKLYNLGKFVKNAISAGIEKPETLKLMDRWLLSKYSELVNEMTALMDSYRYDKAIKLLENFTWHVFADHYVEMIKHRITEDSTRYTLYTVFLGIVKMIGPFMPHITEEIYQEIFRDREGEKSIHLTKWPESIMKDNQAEEYGEIVKEIIAEIRRWKNEEKREINEIIVEGFLGDTSDIEGTFKSKVSMGTGHEAEEKVIEVKPNFGVIGPRYREKAKEIIAHIKSSNPEELWENIRSKKVKVNGVNITEDMVEVKKAKVYHGKKVSMLHVKDVTVLIL